MANAAVSNIAKALTLRTLLEENKSKFAEILPSHLRRIRGYEDRLVKAALVALNNNPSLLNCTQESIIQAVMRSAELGLDPSGTLGSGYLIAYGDQCVFSVGYRGFIDLAKRSSAILDIEARVVYKNDPVFTVDYGTEPRLIHTPTIEGVWGEIIAVYAVAVLQGGLKKFEIMSRSEIEEVRKKSKMPNGGAWKDFYGEMCRKVVIRRFIKYLPISPEVLAELNNITSSDDEYFGLEETIAEKTIPSDGRKIGFGRSKEAVKEEKEYIEIDSVGLKEDTNV